MSFNGPVFFNFASTLSAICETHNLTESYVPTSASAALSLLS